MGAPPSAQETAGGRRKTVKTGQPTGQWPTPAIARKSIARIRKTPSPSHAVSPRSASVIGQFGGASDKCLHGPKTPLQRADRPKAPSPIPWIIVRPQTPLKAGIWPGGVGSGIGDRYGPRGDPYAAHSSTPEVSPATDAAADATPATPDMRMLLWRFPGRSHTWLRFGAPFAVHPLDAQRRIALFAPRAICCRVQWVANAYGPIFWQLMILQAGSGAEAVQRVRGAAPGAHILLHAQGERAVRQMLCWLDNMDVAGITLTHVAPAYWRTVHNRLTARMALPLYTDARRFAHQARQDLCPDEDAS